MGSASSDPLKSSRRIDDGRSSTSVLAMLASAHGSNDAPLSAAEFRDLGDIAGTMIPADAALGVPGADDPAILDDIVRSVGRDLPLVREALAAIGGEGGRRLRQPGPRQARGPDQRLLRGRQRRGRALGRVILGAYYRDDRVLLSLRHEARAPFPKGYTLEQGDWSLLDAVRTPPAAVARRPQGAGDMSRQRARRRADHRRRRLGRRGRLEPRRDRMRILCLEQGDWMKPTDFPTNGRDWEARRYTDFDISPNRRGRDTDYPVNDANSPIKVANFNGVGGSTIIYTAHFPRMHPSDFRVKTLDGVADDWPIDYWTLEPFFDENDRMMGVSGLAGDPGFPPHEPPMPPMPLGKTGTHYARAMNKLGWHWWPSDTAHRHDDYEGRAPCINLGHCTPGCAQGAKASTDITYWPHAHPRRRRAAHALPGARDHHRRARHGVRRDLLRRRRARSSSSRPRS